MEKFNLKEIIAIHKAISELDIKGADASFVTSLLTKVVKEANRLQKLEEQVTTK